MRASINLLLIILGGAGLFPLLATAASESSDCTDAVSNYDLAVDDIAQALKRYSTCLNNSRGHDDCDSEFDALRRAQNNFETAVGAMKSSCKK
ncbi:MAG: hypothetical protein ABSE43_00405 [Steroidobacteraceae bacterium]|jgi:hypothetical protein